MRLAACLGYCLVFSLGVEVSAAGQPSNIVMILADDKCDTLHYQPQIPTE